MIQKHSILLNIIIIAIMMGLNTKAYSQKNILANLKGPYLGQKPPGKIPVIFAPGNVSTELHEHSFPSFSPDGNQILWTSQFRDDGGFPKRVIGSNNNNGIWTEPDFFEAITFANSSSAFFAPDGNRIYFSSSSNGNDKEKGFGNLDIWYIEKSKKGWSSPKNLGVPINSPNHEFGVTLTKDMTLYFSGEIDPDRYFYGIYRSELIDGIYQTPELLPENINSEYFQDWTPFIAPDETYLLFASGRPNGYGSDDLYYAFNFFHVDRTENY